MTHPTPYDHNFSFTDFSATTPSAHQPCVRLDGEFDAIKQTTDEVRANLAKIQRDDGALRFDFSASDTIKAATIFLYQRSANPPAAPSAIATYTWNFSFDNGIGSIPISAVPLGGGSYHPIPVTQDA